MKIGDLVTHSERYTALMGMFDGHYSRKQTGIIVRTRPNIVAQTRTIYSVLWDDGTTYDHDEPELEKIS